MYFEMLYIINIYRYLQIPQVFPQGSCYESEEAIQSLHPGLKIIEQSLQISRHASVCPRGYPPPPGWPLISPLRLLDLSLKYDLIALRLCEAFKSKKM